MSAGKLTSIERVVLACIARWDPHPGHGNTCRSLERKGLIEHTSLGWRITAAGERALEKTA